MTDVISADLAVGTLVAEGHAITRDEQGRVSQSANVWEKQDDGTWNDLTQTIFDKLTVGQGYITNEVMVEVAAANGEEYGFFIITQEQFDDILDRQPVSLV